MRQARRGGVLTNEVEPSLPQALSGLELPKLKPVAGVRSGPVQPGLRCGGEGVGRLERSHGILKIGIPETENEQTRVCSFSVTL